MNVAIMAPVHVAGLTRHLSLPRGTDLVPSGMGGYCINSLIDARLRRGWRTDVVTLDTDCPADMLRLDGPLLRIWVVRRRRARALRDGFARERRLILQAVNEAAPDLLHAHWTYEYGLSAVLQSRYPAVVTVHDHALRCARWLGCQYWPMVAVTLRVILRARHITAVSPYVADWIRRLVRRPVPCIPNLLPEAIRSLSSPPPPPAGEPRHVVRIVSALNWSRLKNTRRALAAFHQARTLCLRNGMDLRYTLMGAGLECGGAAEAWARRHQMTDGVSFLGVIPHRRALDHIAAASILFHPSHEEALPGPVCEAMALGIPVLAAREAEACRWLCGDNRGVLCDGFSSGGMADAIVAMSRRTADGQDSAARQWIATLTSEDRILADWNHIYTQALAAGKETGTHGDSA